MRGRTLEDCFITLDEAQNTTKTQMKIIELLIIIQIQRMYLIDVKLTEILVYLH